MLHKLVNKIVYSIREKVFGKIESLSINQLNNIPVGKWLQELDQMLMFYMNCIQIY